MNNKEYAFSEGEKAGEARRQRDNSRVSFIMVAFGKWVKYNSNTSEEESELNAEFYRGYKEGYGLPSGGSHFR